MYVCMYVKAKR